MPKDVKQIKIFVSCPRDLEEEKQLVRLVCDDINQGLQHRCNVSLFMVDWVNSVVPLFGPRLQEIINEQIGEYDIFIGILWKRFGTPPGAKNPHTGEAYESGTEEEFQIAYDKWKEKGDPQISFYFKQEANSLPSLSEMESFQKVLRFKDRLINECRGWVVDFRTDRDFERMVRRFLQKACFDIDEKLGEKKSEVVQYSEIVFKQSYEDVKDYLTRKVCAVSDYNSAASRYLPPDKAQDFSHVVKNHNRVVLLSDAGAGKTTELKHLLADYSRPDSNYYPYWISLNKYVSQSLPDLLPETWKQVPDEQLLIVLDGLDEIESKNKNDAIRQIELFAENHPSSHIVVSCRANFYNTELKNLSGTLNEFISYILLDLSSVEIRQYIESILNNQTEKFYSLIESKNLYTLLSIPFYLVRLAQLFSSKSQLPETKAELFEELLASRFELDKSHFRTTIDLEEKHREITVVLEKIALVMESLGRNYISDSEYKEMVPDEPTRTLLKYCTAWKKEKSEAGQWQFDHNNFQEYIAAKILSKQELQVIKAFVSFEPSHSRIIPSWVNTLSFLVSILEKKSELFNELLKWILEIEPGLAVKFEVDRLDSETRFEIFTRIFNEYKEKQIWIDRHKFEYKELARFGQSQQAYEFLMYEAENATHDTTLVNAIELLRYSDVPSGQSPSLTKLLISRALNESNEYVQSQVLLAMSDLGLNSQETINQIVPVLRSSTSDWVRYGLYYLLHNSSYLDENIDVFLEGASYAGRIVVSSWGEDNKSRLADEGWHLSQGLEKVSSPEAIVRIFKHFSTNPEDLNNAFLERTFPGLAQKAAAVCSIYPAVFDSVLNLAMSLLNIGKENEAKLLLPFFDLTKTRMRTFQQAFVQRKDIQNSMGALAFFADTECLKYFVQQYLDHNLTNDDIWWFQNNLGFLNYDLYLPFNQLINEKSGNRFVFQPTRDIKQDRKLQLEQDINLLFNKPAFFDEVKQIFDQEEKDSFTKDELLNIKVRHRGDDNFSNLAFRTLFRLAEGEPVTEEKAVGILDKNWDLFRINNLYEYLQNDEEGNLSSDQIDWIASWCYDHLNDVNFKEALKSDGKGQTSTSHSAILLWFFLYRLKLNYPKKVLLDLLSFDWIEGHQLKGISYLEARLPEHEITNRVLENLNVGIENDDILKNHIDYCKRHQIKEVVPHALNTISNENRNSLVREQALEAINELSDSISDLELLLPAIKDGFKWSIVKYLIKRNSNTCIPYLRNLLERETEQQKLNAAIYLMELQDLRGLEFYVDLVEREKEYVGKSFDKSPLQSLREVDAVPLLIKLLTISYEPDFKNMGFYRLDRAVLDSLNSIALKSDKSYETVRQSVLDFMDKMAGTVKGVNSFHYFLDNLERSYYTTKSQNLSLQEALSKVRNLI